MSTRSHADETTTPGVPPVPGKWRAGVLYAVLTLVLMFPISVRPGDVLPADHPDIRLGIWMIAWDVHAFTHQPLSIFDANMFYPQRRTLAYQDNLIGSALFAAPVLWLTGNPVLALNFISLLACVLCGLGAYILARRLGLSEAAAWLTGLIFAFSPARFFRFPQVGLAPVQWIPLTLASLHAYLQGGHRRDLRLAVGFFTLQTLTSGHGAVFLLVALLTLLAYRLALGEPIHLRRRIGDLGLTGGLLLLPAVLAYVPYRMNQIEVGLRRGLGSWGNVPESFLASPTHLHTYLLSVFGLSAVNERAYGFLFPGYLPIVLALVALVGLARTMLRSRQASREGPSVALPLQLAMAAAVGVAGALALRTLRHEAETSTVILSQLLWPWLVCAGIAGGLLVASRAQEAGTRARRWPVVLLVSAVAAWGILTAARAALPVASGLKAQYYDNADSIGWPAVSVVDPKPSTAQMKRRWKDGPPETFSVRWIGYLAVGRPGLYRFATTSDDGSQLHMNDQLVVDNSGAHATATQSGEVWLARGFHRIQLDYVQFGGDFELEWSWAADGADYTPVPAWALSQRGARYPAVVAARVTEWAMWICAATAALAALCWLGLSVRGAWRPWRERAAAARHNPVPVYAALTFLCIGLALGPPYSLWPYVYQWPGFSFIRAPLRFMVLGALAIAVLAGFGFDRFAGRFSPGRRRLFALAAGTLLVVEFAAMPVISVPFALDIPAADQWVARQPKPFVIAEVPLGGAEQHQTTYLLHSMAHWQKTVAGYGGITPPLNRTLNWELHNFPDEITLHRLAEIGVTYVIVHIDLYSPEAWAGVDERLRSFEGAWLTLEYADETGRVYSLRRPAIP